MDSIFSLYELRINQTTEVIDARETAPNNIDINMFNNNQTLLDKGIVKSFYFGPIEKINLINFAQLYCLFLSIRNLNFFEESKLEIGLIQNKMTNIYPFEAYRQLIDCQFNQIS